MALGDQTALTWKSCRCSQLVPPSLQSKVVFSPSWIAPLTCYYNDDESTSEALSQSSPYLPGENGDFFQIQDKKRPCSQWWGVRATGWEGISPAGNRTKMSQGCTDLMAVRGLLLSSHEDRKNRFEVLYTERGSRLRIRGDTYKKHQKWTQGNCKRWAEGWKEAHMLAESASSKSYLI